MHRIKNRPNLNTVDYWDSYYKTDDVNTKLKNRLKFYQLITAWLPEQAHSLLEVGCATGYGLNYIQLYRPDYRLVGTDFSPSAIEKARVKYPTMGWEVLDIVEGNVEGLWDYILCIETLEHLEDPITAIDKCLNHCKQLIVTVPKDGADIHSKTHVMTGFNKAWFDEHYKTVKYNSLFTGRYIAVMLEVK
jgi:2-polyprenyl-3-methyl-5-hydroxy-6-metoxy-1,4-benzoquinol methylase